MSLHRAHEARHGEVHRKGERTCCERDQTIPLTCPTHYSQKISFLLQPQISPANNRSKFILGTKHHQNLTNRVYRVPLLPRASSPT